MERGFIMAEVMAFDEFKAEGSEAACKVSFPFFLHIRFTCLVGYGRINNLF